MIAHPVTYIPTDAALVDVYNDQPNGSKSGTSWSDDIYSSMKSRIKSHYINEQQHRCCYCNRETLSDNHNMWNTEHIVPKTKHPRFMFEPQNLAASCPDCNIAKGEDEVMNNPNLVNYPTGSDAFKIVHPHFDEFDQHIAVHELVYVGKTKKGRRTIYMCDLLRYASDHIDWGNDASDTRFEGTVEAIFNESPSATRAIAAAMSQIPDN